MKALAIALKLQKLEAALLVRNTHHFRAEDFIEDDFSHEPGGGPPCYRHPARGRPIYL
jgi:hypothetical protein